MLFMNAGAPGLRLAACADGTAEVIGRDFAREVAERMAEAFSELIVTASAGDYSECDIIIDAIAEVSDPTDGEPSRRLQLR